MYLSDTLPVAAYAKLVPSVQELVQTHRLERAAAFHLVRPSLRTADGKLVELESEVRKPRPL